MSEALKRDLRDAIANGSALVVVGSGVSIAATAMAPCASWLGLILNGIAYCEDLYNDLPDGFADQCRRDLSSGDLDQRLRVAERISSTLGAPNGGEFANWLRHSVGRLRATSTELLDAIASLKLPIATTNYDDLLSSAMSVRPVTWRRGALVERVVRGDESGILHIHGHWEDPESVVLGIKSFERVLADQHAQLVLRALRLTKTWVFVGCGDGLTDPNMGALLRWSQEVFAGSPYRHYVLACAGDAATLRHAHPREERLFVLEYGTDFDELAPFLRNLATPPGGHLTIDVASAETGQADTGARFHALPAEPFCVGREAQIDVVVSFLLKDRPRPTPVVGAPGIGKSTVALRALHDRRVEGKFDERRVFVRCDNASSRKALIDAIALALGAPLGDNLEERVFLKVGDGAWCVVLDNVETAWEKDRESVEELLKLFEGIPSLALVATIRGRERPLGIWWNEKIEVGPLEAADARSLFLEVAGQSFVNDPLLDSLVGAMDGLPLAIALLAHVAEGESSLAGLAGRWHNERTALLAREGISSRFTSVEVSLELSVMSSRVTNSGRDLLSVLSALPGGVLDSDVDSVLPGSGTRAASALRRTGLAFGEEGRLKVLAPVREYVARRWPPGAELLRPAVDHFLRLVVNEDDFLGTARGNKSRARVAAELNNIEVSIASAVEGDRTQAIKAALHYGEFCRGSGLGSDAPLRHVLTFLMEPADNGNRAAILMMIAAIAVSRYDLDGARDSYEQALTFFRGLSSRYPEAECIFGLGMIAQRRSEYATATKHLDHALAIFRDMGDLRGSANCLRILGEIELRHSRHGAATERFQEAMGLYQRLDSLLGEANCLVNLGEVARETNPANARPQFERALQLFLQAGDALGEANCIHHIGVISGEDGNRDLAREQFERALSLYRGLGNLRGEANTVQNLGHAARDGAGNLTARQFYRDALAIYSKIPDPYAIGFAHLALAEIATSRDEKNDHCAAARQAWLSIGREDLVAKWLFST